jgi:hypothetical protein
MGAVFPLQISMRRSGLFSVKNLRKFLILAKIFEKRKKRGVSLAGTDDRFELPRGPLAAGRNRDGAKPFQVVRSGRQNYR